MTFLAAPWRHLILTLATMPVLTCSPVAHAQDNQRARFSPDTWTWEVRPIIDKQAGRYYLAFDPAIDRSWHGQASARALPLHRT